MTVIFLCIIGCSKNDSSDSSQVEERSNPTNISLKEKTFSFEPEVTIKLSKKKYKFFEVPISYNGRSYQEGKKIGLKDAFIALKTIIFYSLKP